MPTTSTAPTITEYLKYANLQMAAEAFLKDPDTDAEYYSGTVLIDALTTGNKHASKFTTSEAEKFEKEWVVLDQCKNTDSGFSGTLFRNKANPNELVISFRSTEFIDDAVNDCQVTNKTIKDFGWGFGQIADMEKWYDELKQKGNIPAGATLTVTGYSLGAHMATAFNFLRKEEEKAGLIRVSGTDHDCFKINQRLS
jgi:poly(3-hydroxybutyrate) depolymerase